MIPGVGLAGVEVESASSANRIREGAGEAVREGTLLRLAGRIEDLREAGMPPSAPYSDRPRMPSSPPVAGKSTTELAGELAAE